MTNNSAGDLFARLKAAKSASAVLKAELITLRSRAPHTPILVFEGVDDKTVYGHWIRRLGHNFRYEMFLCGGKRGVCALSNSLHRDLGTLKENVYYFVDRDFDDLEDFDDISNVMMTDRYSIENYLVEGAVVDAVLAEHFPCHSRPDIRMKIIEIFNEDYDKFLTVTKEINRRIFVARKAKIELAADITDKVSRLAIVEIGKVRAADIAAMDLIRYAQEVDAEIVEAFDGEFEKIDPRMRYRGKFAFKFMVDWFHKLAAELVKPDGGVFGEELLGRVHHAELVLGGYAAKSPLPNHFACFLDRIFSEAGFASHK